MSDARGIHVVNYVITYRYTCNYAHLSDTPNYIYNYMYTHIVLRACVHRSELSRRISRVCKSFIKQCLYLAVWILVQPAVAVGSPRRRVSGIKARGIGRKTAGSGWTATGIGGVSSHGLSKAQPAVAAGVRVGSQGTMQFEAKNTTVGLRRAVRRSGGITNPQIRMCTSQSDHKQFQKQHQHQLQAYRQEKLHKQFQKQHHTEHRGLHRGGWNL